MRPSLVILVGLGLWLGCLTACTSSRAPAPATVSSGAKPVPARHDPELIGAAVRSRHGAIRRCYERGLARDPALRGQMNVFFRIAPDGAVTFAREDDSGARFGDPTVTECVVGEFRGLRFAPAQEEQFVVYPLVFEAG